jgi:hypothetical protein
MTVVGTQVAQDPKSGQKRHWKAVWLRAVQKRNDYGLFPELMLSAYNGAGR